MSQLTYYNYEGYGQKALEQYHYSQAVILDGGRIECAGQGGWDRSTGDVKPDLAEQIQQAFENVQHNLKNAGGRGWDDVYKVTTYNVDLDGDIVALLIKNLKKFCPNHKPCWTALGVARLASPEMKVEIDVVAQIPKESA